MQDADEPAGYHLNSHVCKHPGRWRIDGLVTMIAMQRRIRDKYDDEF